MPGQGANNGPSQAAGNNQFVKFSRGSAQRIAKVVRQVEQGDRNQPGLTFEHPTLGPPMFRMCTYTGSWAKDTVHTVTFYGITSTPNTSVATNLFVNVATCNTASSNTTAACAIARFNGTWYLIAAGCSCA